MQLIASNGDLGVYKKNLDFLNGKDHIRERCSNYQIKKFADKLKDIVCLLIGCTREQLEDREFKEKELGKEWWKYKITIEDHNGIQVEYKPYLKHKELESEEYWINLGIKEYHVEVIKLTPRKLLQLLGTECGREIIHPNIWANALFADYNPKFKGVEYDNLKEYYPNWIITDCRFFNEAQVIKDKGGIVIRVNRGGFSITNGKEIVSNIIETDDLKGYDEFVYQDEASNIYRTSEWKRIKEHLSETSLDNYDFDYVIDNNSDILSLIEKIKALNIV